MLSAAMDTVNTASTVMTNTPVSNDAEVEDAGRSRSQPQVRTEAGQKTTNPDGSQKDSLELSREAQEIRDLQLRDKEVRAHEAAHAATGGQYAGSPSYSFEKGPDGKTYATEGEVRIDISPVSGDPEATLQKANQVRAAALAPAEPSSQDMKVAQKAQLMAARARQELSSSQTDSEDAELTEAAAENSDPDRSSSVENRDSSAYSAYAGDISGFISLNIYT